MNKPVSFPLAKLLKDKGFEVKIRPYFFEKSIGSGSYMYNPKGLLELCTMPRVGLENGWIDAPNISDVIMWLYEKHGIWITVTSISQVSWQCHMTKKGDSLGKCYLEDFYTPTEAYEAAIEYCLTNLI